MKIIETCKNAGLKEPVWSVESSTIKLTFFGNSIDTPIRKGVTEGVIEGVTEDVKDKIKKTLLVVYRNKGLKIPEIAQKTNIPMKSIERYVIQLRDGALVEFRGEPKLAVILLQKS